MTVCRGHAPGLTPLTHFRGLETGDTARQAVHALLRMVKLTSRDGAKKDTSSFEPVLISICFVRVLKTSLGHLLEYLQQVEDITAAMATTR
jgi:hypothetical protein